jgi:CPW-WPC domain-containing protein
MRVLFALVSTVLAQLDIAGSLQTPPGVGQLMGKMSSTLTAANGGQDPAAKKKIVDGVLNAGMKQLQEKVVSQFRSQAMQADALTYATAQVRKQRFIGGCARDYGFQCPTGWLKAPKGGCAPSDAYDGPCGRVALASASRQEKENFAVQCQVEWPCVAACELDFSGCPQGWSGSAAACEAPQAYAGICAKRTDFSEMDDADKARWAALCEVSWPCKKEAAPRASEQFASLSGPITEEGVAMQAKESEDASAPPARVQEVDYPIQSGPLPLAL